MIQIPVLCKQHRKPYITNFIDPPAVSVHTEWLDVHYNIK